jgi:hypothetical protein
MWSPESRLIVFRSNPPEAIESPEWWVVPIDGGTPEVTGWTKLSIDKHASAGEGNVWLPGDVLIFWQQLDDTSRIYRSHIDRKAWKNLTEPESLTFGTAPDRYPSVAAGKVAFQSGRTTDGVWSLPADTNQGRATGVLEKLTSDNAEHDFATPTPDGP